MEESDEANNLAVPLHCPHCGGAIDAVLSDRPQVIDCPHCARPFLLPAADGSTLPVARLGDSPFVVDDAPMNDRDDDLDGTRIRQISAARRAAVRSRSYLLIAAGVAIVAAIQLLFYAADAGRARLGTWGIAYAGSAVACLWFAARFWSKASEMKREIDRSLLKEPCTPPDFSTLRDGSQRWKNFDDLHS